MDVVKELKSMETKFHLHRKIRIEIPALLGEEPRKVRRNYNNIHILSCELFSSF